jgi:hypothetical protein
MPALTVFSTSIRYLKKSLLEECRKQNYDTQEADIKWIITVPAIWSDPAKSFMRSAAVQVYSTLHFVHKSIPDTLNTLLSKRVYVATLLGTPFSKFECFIYKIENRQNCLAV